VAPPQMRSRIVGPMLAFVRAQGGDADGLIREFGLPATAESDAEVVLGLPVLHAFQEAAERESKDPFLGVHLAITYRRGLYGVMEYASRSAPTLREALVRIVRFAKLRQDLVVVSLEEHEGMGTIELRVDESPLCLGRHANEFVIATLIDQARLLSGERFIPQRVWLAHPAPRRVDELTSAFHTRDITFGADAIGIAIPTHVLDLPVLTSDPSLLGVLDEHAEASLAQRPAAPDFVSQVRRSIREGMASKAPSLETVATDLRMSARTIQRRLTSEGTSFQRLLESVREELARVHVADPSMPLGEIAFLLGYTELSAFLRAFKRWTGKTPRQFRGSSPG
jgi:AraC-like DNA-binding protein